MRVKFHSKKFDREIVADVIEKREHTCKLKLPDGNIIIKKWKQVENV